MVRKVAIQEPLKPRTNQRHGFMPSLVELGPDRGYRRSHALLGRQPHDLELSFSVGSTTMREPKEVKRLRPSLLPYSTPLGRKAAKLDQCQTKSISLLVNDLLVARHATLKVAWCLKL